VAGTIRQLCCQDIGGDHQRLDEVNTKHLGVIFKHSLLPVWLASYRYRDKLYQILVNARTGEVVGRRPYSVAKIVSLIVAIILAAALIFFIVSRAHSAPMVRDASEKRARFSEASRTDHPGCAYAAITAFADRSPSTAALTMPPAYPAPSPTGNSPSIPGDCRVAGSRT